MLNIENADLFIVNPGWCISRQENLYNPYFAFQQSIINFIMPSLPINGKQQQIQWKFAVKKQGLRTYLLEMTAILAPGWHLFSAHQPDDAIIFPTAIDFEACPVASFIDDIMEVGRLEKYYDEGHGIEVFQYSGKVRFLQTVELMEMGILVIRATIHFQIGTNQECLRPAQYNVQFVLK